MKYKKRKKASRMSGSRTHGRGAGKRTRGSGNKGGVGKAGTGKRADQKKTLVLKEYGKEYFRKDKTLRRGKKKEINAISLENLVNKMESFIKKGIAKGKEGNYEINLKDYKIIGNFDV